MKKDPLKLLKEALFEGVKEAIKLLKEENKQ